MTDEFSRYCEEDKNFRAKKKLELNDGKYDPNVVYLSVKEIAKDLKMTSAGVQHHIWSGKLKAQQFTSNKSKKWLIHPSDYHEFLKIKDT